MTDEEMAKEYSSRCACLMEDIPIIEKAYLAGLKAGRPQWHYLRYADLPKEDNKIVLCVEINGYIESKPNYVYKLLTKNDFPFTHGLVAWCEIPKYEED